MSNDFLIDQVRTMLRNEYCNDLASALLDTEVQMYSNPDLMPKGFIEVPLGIEASIMRDRFDIGKPWFG